MKPTVKECFDGSKFNEYWCSECGGYIIDSTMGLAARPKVCKHCGAEIEWGKQHRTFTLPSNNNTISNKTEMTPKEALKEISNTTILSRVRDWGIEIRHVSDLSSTKESLQIIEQALTELEGLKRDVARYFELQYKNQFDSLALNEINKMYVLREKLSKIDKEE